MIEDETLICQAIHQQRQVAFLYRERDRVVEPYCYGVDAGGASVLRGYQVTGESDTGAPAWKLFRVRETTGLRVLDERFDAPHERYVRNDPSMSKIYCEL